MNYTKYLTKISFQDIAFRSDPVKLGSNADILILKFNPKTNVFKGHLRLLGKKQIWSEFGLDICVFYPIRFSVNEEFMIAFQGIRKFHSDVWYTRIPCYFENDCISNINLNLALHIPYIRCFSFSTHYVIHDSLNLKKLYIETSHKEDDGYGVLNIISNHPSIKSLTIRDPLSSNITLHANIIYSLIEKSQLRVIKMIYRVASVEASKLFRLLSGNVHLQVVELWVSNDTHQSYQDLVEELLQTNFSLVKLKIFVADFERVDTFVIDFTDQLTRNQIFLERRRSSLKVKAAKAYVTLGDLPDPLMIPDEVYNLILKTQKLKTTCTYQVRSHKLSQ